MESVFVQNEFGIRFRVKHAKPKQQEEISREKFRDQI